MGKQGHLPIVLIAGHAVGLLCKNVSSTMFKKMLKKHKLFVFKAFAVMALNLLAVRDSGCSNLDGK